MNLTKLEELLNKDIGTLKEVETTLETAKYNFSLRRITQYLGEFLENISDVDLQNTYPRLKATARFEKTYSSEPQIFFMVLRFADKDTNNEVDLFKISSHENRKLMESATGSIAQLSNSVDGKLITFNKKIYSSEEYYIDLTNNKQTNLEILLEQLVDKPMQSEIRKLFLEAELLEAPQTHTKRNKL